MPRKTLAKGSFRPRSTGRVPPWLRRLLSVLMLGLLGFAQSCGTGPDGDSNIGQQSLPIGENCSLVSPEFLGSGDGCDCPSDGDTSCDPDCAVENEGGGYCGCEFCYGTPPPPGPECGQVPAEFRDIRDGCDCPWDGDTSCDPDCIFDGNSGGADCGCEFCHGAPPPVPEPPTFPTLTAPPAVPAPALKSTNASGALPGGGEVSQDGAYTYSIPIEVPRGRAGVEPNISLEYSSRGANGIMGMGWSILGAGSSISRCARINAAGRLTDRVNFDSDRYCLDGQRLLVVSGSYGAPGSEYRTEIDIFAKIVLVSTVPGSGEPIEFKVYYKDGRIGTFSALLSSLKQLTLNPDGSTSATRNVQLVWPLTKLVDRAGNAMTYVYQLTSDSLPIIRHIDYTSCDTTPCAYPSARLRRVQFDYEARAAEDRTERWVNGVKIFSAQRLKEISTFIANGSATTATFERIHRYALSYVQGGVSGRTLLRGIQKCDGASSPVCLPETRFVWNGEASANFAVTTAGAAFTYNLVKLEPITKRYQLMPENTFSVFDVNGDGNDDVVYKSWASSTLDMSVTNQAPQDRLLLADGNGYFAASVPIDPDGDGVAKTGCAGAEVMNPSTAQPSDMDGDGRIEWLAPLNTGCAFVDADTTAGANWTRVQPGTSAGITLEGQANRTMGILAWDRSRSLFTRVSVPTSIGGPSGVTWSRYELRLADVTGDGLPDLLDALLSNSDHWNVSIARKVVRSPTLDPQIDYQARRVGEDLGVIHVPMLGLPTKENALFNPTSFRVLDENGDGRAELIQIDNAGERRSFEFMNNADTIVYRHRKEHSPEATSTSSTPSGGPALPNWGTPNFGGICCGNEPGYWFPVDVNGDGLKDALYETSSAAGSEFRLRMNTGRGYGPAVAVGGAAAALSQYPKDHFYNASIGGAV
ncbi:MAG TPA: SpvB/TcaC N-terminal domain-containing protein, partial [Polyangiaceae bacterium]